MKIFISSTFTDLKEIRRVAINMLNSLTCEKSGDTIAMEFFEACNESCLDVCLNKIRQADLVIGIYGNRYGTVVSDDLAGRSMTEIEFDEAIAHNIPVLRFVANDIETQAEDQQKQFIQNKVFKPENLSARFDLNDPNGFAERLNDSLRKHFNGLDGYEYNSVWDDIRELQEKLSNDDSYPHLTPYKDDEELNAFKQIEESTKYILEANKDLISENDMIHLLAYYYDNGYPKDAQTEAQETINRIKKNPDLFLRNWEVVNRLIPNRIRTIQLSTCYLKLCYVQGKLLRESWTEELRQEILSVKHDYVNFIKTKSMLVD